MVEAARKGGTSRQVKEVKKHLTGTAYALTCHHERFHGGPRPDWLRVGAHRLCEDGHCGAATRRAEEE